MNKDIRVAITFKDHRKRKKLQRRLGAEGVLALLDLWLNIANTNPDGNLKGCDEEDIALDANWTGDPQELVGALVELGFLDRTSEGFQVHNWMEHNAFASQAEARSAAAAKAAEARWNNRVGKVPNPETNAELMRGASGAHPESKQGAPSGNAPSPSPSPFPSPSPSPSRSIKSSASPAPDKYSEDIDHVMNTAEKLGGIPIPTNEKAIMNARAAIRERLKERVPRARLEAHLARYLERKRAHEWFMERYGRDPEPNSPVWCPNVKWNLKEIFSPLRFEKYFEVWKAEGSISQETVMGIRSGREKLSFIGSHTQEDHFPFRDETIFDYLIQEGIFDEKLKQQMKESMAS